MDRASHVAPQLLVPDLGMPGAALTLSLWLVPEGADVLEGDRVVELLSGAATIDLEAPVTGRLVRQLVDEDAAVTPGMVIAEFEPQAEG
jgi:pyruvate/2-oxoglutarate dehydrogenase complex dihydrolipoamide acyltransferase (E2) component